MNLGLKNGDRLAIYADTSYTATLPLQLTIRANWQLMAQAAASQSMSIVTAYATLGEEGLIHSLKETEAKAIFVDPQLISSLLVPLNRAASVRFVIYHGEPKKEHVAKLKSMHSHLEIISYDTLTELGKANPVPPVPPKPSDIACIMYTSGSTGPPKGVLLTHRNVIAAGTQIFGYS